MHHECVSTTLLRAWIHSAMIVLWKLLLHERNSHHCQCEVEAVTRHEAASTRYERLVMSSKSSSLKEVRADSGAQIQWMPMAMITMGICELRRRQLQRRPTEQIRLG